MNFVKVRKFKLNLQTNSIRKNFLILLFASVISKMIGFFREIVIASNFGVSAKFDIFLAIIILPNIVISLLLYALPHIIIPRLNLLNKQREDYYTSFASDYFWPYIIILVLIVFLYNLLFPLYLKANGIFSDDALLIARLLSIYMFFGALFNIFKTLYNSEEKFTLPAYAPLIFHISLICSIVALSEMMGIFSAVTGFCIGAILQIGIFIFDLQKKKILRFFKPRINWIKGLIAPSIIILIIEFLGQAYTLIDRSFYSSLPEGNIAALYYAGIINNLPVSMIGLALGSVLFPRITTYIQSNKYTDLKVIIKKGTFVGLIITIPLTIVFYFWGNLIISITLERGEFSSKATSLTFSYLKMLSLGLIFIFIHIIIVKVYFSIKQEKILLITTTISVVIKWLLSAFFVKISYFPGIALSTSIAFMLNISLLFLALISFFKKNV